MQPTTRRPKKQLTAEQLAASSERKATMRKLATTIRKLSDADRATLAARVQVHTIEGRSLSMCNQCMLALQCPDATLVGGFRQWLAAGRSVRKGEHGASIWIPLGAKDDDGHVKMGEDDHRFMLVTVFDISQTEEVHP